MGAMVVAEVASSMFEGVTSASLLTILDEVKALVPVVVPAVIGFLAFRKGWSFLKSAVKGA